MYCFANISATKAPIFMKFDTWAHKIVKNHQQKFRKDPCTYTRTQRINVRALRNMRARNETCVRATKRTRATKHAPTRLQFVCTWIFTKKISVNLHHLMNLTFIFIKIGALVAEILAKQYRRLLNPQFSMYLAYFHENYLKKPVKNDNY